ncbi:MAG: hypothetical protein ACRD0G_19395 [Acidimicrobiales bacterium]
MNTVSRTRAKRRIIVALAGAALAATTAVVADGVASAHNSIIVGSASCTDNGDYLVDFTATAWAGDGTPESRTNSDISVFAIIDGSDTLVAGGSYSESNGFTFSGQFVAPAATTSLQLLAIANADWGNGFRGGQHDFSDPIALPRDCVPPPTTTPPAPGGCTPGYWKNHTGSWQGYSAGQSTNSVFPSADLYGLGGQSLLQSLNGGGGPGAAGAASILLRAATAALLNASHGDVSYPQGAASIISSVESALASGDRDTMLGLASSLDGQNNAGCPL